MSIRRRDPPPVLPPMSTCRPSAERRRPCPQSATALFQSRRSSPESHRSKAKKRFKWRKQLTQAEKRQDWRKRRQGYRSACLSLGFRRRWPYPLSCPCRTCPCLYQRPNSAAGGRKDSSGRSTPPAVRTKGTNSVAAVGSGPASGSRAPSPECSPDGVPGGITVWPC